MIWGSPRSFLFMEYLYHAWFSAVLSGLTFLSAFRWHPAVFQLVVIWAAWPTLGGAIRAAYLRPGGCIKFSLCFPYKWLQFVVAVILSVLY